MTYRNRALLDLCHEAPCFLLPGQHECLGPPAEPCHSDMIRHGRGEKHKSHDCFAVPGCHNAHLAFTRSNLGKEGYFQAWVEAMERYILWQWVSGKVRIADITQRPKESTMEAPMCKICETRHYVREPHNFKYGGGQHGGKTAALERAAAEFTNRNPNAVVARIKAGDVRIEKPVHGEVVEQDVPRALGIAQSESKSEGARRRVEKSTTSGASGKARANTDTEKAPHTNTSASEAKGRKAENARRDSSADSSSSRITAHAGGTPAKDISSSGLNVNVPSVSLAKSQPETGKLGRQQRVNSGRDSRRDGKNTQREGRRVLKAEGESPDATRSAATAKPDPHPATPGRPAGKQTTADKVTPGKRQTASKKKTKMGKKK